MIASLQALCVRKLVAALSASDVASSLEFFQRSSQAGGRGGAGGALLPQPQHDGTAAASEAEASGSGRTSTIPEHFLELVLQHALQSSSRGSGGSSGFASGGHGGSLTDGVLGGCLGLGTLTVLDLSGPGALRHVSGALFTALRPRHVASLRSLSLGFESLKEQKEAAGADGQQPVGDAGGAASWGCDGPPLAEAAEVLAFAVLALSCAPFLEDLEIAG
jgi:hypothetical protein